MDNDGFGPLRRFALGNVDPHTHPVSAKLTEELRKVFANPSDAAFDSGQITTLVAVSVMELESSVAELRDAMKSQVELTKKLADRIEKIAVHLDLA
ncbi:hypothetical protein SEA_TORTELLINI_39 [Mycobacterium phage Tortellini]|uniref:Uncharacterized protein n=1 Tax=Mycobacterium phage Tortellini TaxID=1897497 RepID=A0A1D8EX46_9CAUD|nr:hypothetical protein FDH05_gp39 [Mycobacterium phage Tortellini]AOT25784.1 hypothetical protein SEA_TORTELLINI_39 [Mycobacterium phage Tortellini]